MSDYISSILVMACAAINTYFALWRYPQSIDPFFAGLAVFCFGIAIIFALEK